MKDITEYFRSSPDDINTQKSSSKHIEISTKSPENEEKAVQSTPKSRRNLIKNETTPANECAMPPNTPKTKKNSGMIKKTAKSTKQVSPVKSPLEAYNKLFNIGKNQSTEKIVVTMNNLNTRMEKVDSVEIDEGNSLDSEISIDMQITPDTPKLNDSKVNAFQFLMGSRNKIIGTNSPGKELSEPDIAPKCSQKLLARKRLLHSWSDSIKAKKRKLNEEEVDKYIKVKLSTRKERLKSLLHIDDNSTDEIESPRTTKRKKKSVKCIKQEEENSNECQESSKDSSTKKLDTKKSNIKENNEKSGNVGFTSLSSGDDFEKKIADSTAVTTPRSSKTHKHKKKSKDNPAKMTPRSKWKMKIKLISHDHDDTNIYNEESVDNDMLNENHTSIMKVTEGKDCLSASRVEMNVENDVMIVDQSENSIKKELDFQHEVTDIQAINTPKSNKENDVIVLDESPNSLEAIKIVDCKEINNPQSTSLPESNGEGLKGENKYNGSTRVLRNRKCLNTNKDNNYVYSSEESDDEIKKKNNKKPVKIAPVFIKAIPKPKVDPAILEARRKFLMSEMPDELRKRIEKIPSNGHNVEIDFDVFPKISHVCQEETYNPLWNLPASDLKLNVKTPFTYDKNNLLCKSLIDHRVIQPSRYGESEPIKNIKTILMDFKMQHPNYPIYRSFRLLKEKNGFKAELVTKKSTPKRRSKPRKSNEKKEDTSTGTDIQNSLEHLMWTEKYKPRSSEDIFGNIQAASSLKKWLEKWREVLDTGKRKRKQFSSDSDSEFMSSDAESIYDRSLSTTVILSGPCGSGKSSTVYAVCNELGLNVLELNASSKRTGKQVLQELQEATRSHQVRKNKGLLDAFTNKKTLAEAEKHVEKNKSRRMCVLLIEDIDIVFDQDEGFINAISQISSTSKRPIILTTTNESSIYVQKFLSEFKIIRFHPISFKSLGVWLQILCILEGIFIDLSSIGELLEYNKGDIRKTLLELQYWTQSGGQINKRNTLLDPIFEIENMNDGDNPTSIFDDAPTPLKELNETLDDYRIHSNILSDFENFQSFKFNNIPTTIDLKTLWWNLPKFIHPAKPKPSTPSSKKSNSRNRKRLKLVSDMYESAAIFDMSYRKIGFKCDKPVCTKRWDYQLQDSLEVGEKLTSFSIDENVLELNHYLTNGYLDSCKKKFIYESSENQRFLNMAVPGLEKERQLNNGHKYEEELLRPVPLVNSLDRKSVVLDYLPSLRSIARTECQRAKNNSKRHNRFHNYLQNLNIICDTPILDFATRTFSTSSYSH